MRQTTPSEIIPLESASIHSLLGGQRRRDLKRSAAIVDKQNNIHFMVANSELELEFWYQRILKAISLATEALTSTAVTPEHQLPSLTNKGIVTLSGQDQEQERPRDSTTAAASVAAYANGAIAANNSGSFREPSKNRFSSVLSAARQKGKEVAERTKQRLAAPADLRPRTGSTDSTSPQCWTCEMCTYAYNTGSATCEMCGAIARGNRSRNSSEDSGAASWICPSCSFSNRISAEKCEMCSSPNEGIERLPSADEPDKDQNNTAIELNDNRPALRQRFGAAVRLARSKGKELASNISREVVSDTEPKALQLRNVLLDSSTEIDTMTMVENVELCLLEGDWKFSICCKGLDKEDLVADRSEADDDKDTLEFQTSLMFEVKSTKLVAYDEKPITVTVALVQILQLHREISEMVSKIPLSSYVFSKESERTSSSHMSERTEALLGISAVDMIRSTARTLGGMVRHASRPETRPHLSRHVEDFFVAISECPLPLECLSLFTDLLHLPFLTVPMDKVGDRNEVIPQHSSANEATTSPEQWHSSLKDIFELSSLCEIELLRAENQSRMAEDLTRAKAPPALAANAIPLQQRLQITETPSQINEAMRATLIRVMEERDEAQARCISRDVLHSHELEQERRRTALVETKLAALMKISEESNMFSNDKDRREFQALRRHDRQQQQESDAELMSLCQQLSSEISARTLAELEVARLQEIRKLELENDAKDKQAMQDEMVQLRRQLDREKQRSALLRTESGTWRESFEDAVRIQESLPSPPPPRKLPQHLDRRFRSFDR